MSHRENLSHHKKWLQINRDWLTFYASKIDWFIWLNLLLILIILYCSSQCSHQSLEFHWIPCLKLSNLFFEFHQTFSPNLSHPIKQISPNQPSKLIDNLFLEIPYPLPLITHLRSNYFYLLRISHNCHLYSTCEQWVLI